MKNKIIKKLFILCVCLTGFLASKAQTNRAFLLRTDSTYQRLQNIVKTIYKEYHINDENATRLVLPDSVNKVLEKTFLLIDKREKEIDKLAKPYAVDQERKDRDDWHLLTDSIIALKKLTWKAQQKIGFGIGHNQGYMSAQYAFILNQYRSFDFGIGSGIEYVNRGSGLVHILQMPVYVTNVFFLNKFVFLNFDYGISIPLSGSFKNNKNEETTYKEAELNNNFYFDIGLGVLDKSDVGIQFNVRNQSLGVPEPLNQRAWMFGFKLSF